MQQTKTVVAAMERRSRAVEAALAKAAEAKENAEACMKLATERGHELIQNLLDAVEKEIAKTVEIREKAVRGYRHQGDPAQLGKVDRKRLEEARVSLRECGREP